MAMVCLISVHPETLPKLKLWIPRYPLFGVQSFSFGNIFGVSGWTLINCLNPDLRDSNILGMVLVYFVRRKVILP